MTRRQLDLLADALAERVLERLADAMTTPPGALVDAAAIAERFGVSRDWVYEHCDEIGAIRLGDSPRARLRFDPATVADCLAARPSPATDPHPPRRSVRPDVDLLPIGPKR